MESDPLYQSIIESQRSPPEATTPDAIMAAVHEVTQTIQRRAIICWTKTGSTALRAARERSEAPIIALTPQHRDRAAAVAGLGAALPDDGGSSRPGRDGGPARVDFAEREGFAEAGERVVITAGVPLGVAGATNMLRVAMVGTK